MITTFNFQEIHPLAIEVCRLLQTVGYQAYIVGGCVRDLHMGLVPKDWDICTSATPQQVMQVFPRTLPTGLQHGTVTVCMGEGTENHFEVTTFRVEGKYVDGRRPEEVSFVQDIKEDLARRDFTINAMAYDPIHQVHIDPFGGQQDLYDHLIRAVGDANARFQEDGLRIMRAARFAARFGYQIEQNTFTGMKANLETLKKVSKERISEELRKTLMSKHRDHGMMLLLETNVLGIVCPLLNNTSVTELKKLNKCKGELETQLALLYHNFWSNLVKQDLLDLKFSNKEVKRVAFLLDMLTAFRILLTQKSASHYTKFMARFKNEAPDPWEASLEQFIELTSALQLPIRKILRDYGQEVVWARKELAVNGDDLMAIGVPQGPELKRLLDLCYQEIMEHPEHNNREFLLDFVAHNP